MSLRYGNDSPLCFSLGGWQLRSYGGAIHVICDPLDLIERHRIVAPIVEADHAVGRMEVQPRKLPLTFQNAPPLGNGSGDGQNAAGKQDREIGFNPGFELSSPLPWRPQEDPFADFAETH